MIPVTDIIYKADFLSHTNVEMVLLVAAVVVFLLQLLSAQLVENVMAITFSELVLFAKTDGMENPSETSNILAIFTDESPSYKVQNVDNKYS